MMFYKDTGLQDSPIGKISKDWEIQELSDFVEIETGKRAKGGGLSEGTVASIGGEHIDRHGNILWIDMKYIPEDLYGLLKQGRVRLEDILLVKDGATTGKVAIAEYLKYERVAVNEHVFLIRSKTERLSNRFLFHFLFSKFGQRQIRTRFHGLIGGIMRSDLETVLVPIPSIVEQRAVVGVLGVVDSAIELVDRVIWKTERLKKGLMQELLTKGIGHKEYKDTPIGKIPKEWDVVRLKDIAIIERGKFAHRPRNEPRFYGGKIPFIQTGDIAEAKALIKNYSQTLNEEGLKISKLFKKGTIVVSIAGNIGDVGVLDFDSCFPDSVIGISVRDDIDVFFLMYMLQNLQYELSARAPRSTQKNINLEILGSLRVLIPPFSEQEKIAAVLSDVNTKLELERKEKAKLEKIKRGLMDLLLTGKVRVKVD